MNEYVKKSLKIGGLLALCGALFSGGLIGGYYLGKNNSKQDVSNSAFNINVDKPNNAFNNSNHDYLILSGREFADNDYFNYVWSQLSNVHGTGSSTLNIAGDNHFIVSSTRGGATVTPNPSYYINSIYFDSYVSDGIYYHDFYFRQSAGTDTDNDYKFSAINAGSTNMYVEPSFRVGGYWTPWALKIISHSIWIPKTNAYFDILSNSYSYYFQTGKNQGNSEGYQTGYSEGYTVGNSEGYHTGYSDGYTTGYSDGYVNAGEESESPEYLYKIDFQDNINKYAPFGVYSDYFIINTNTGSYTLFEGLFVDSLENQYKKITITYAQGEGTKYGENAATLKTMPEGSLLFMYISFIDINDNEIVACYPVYKNREGGTYYTLETTWRSSAFQHLTILEDNTTYEGAVFRSFDNSQTALSSFNSGATGVQKQSYSTGPFALLSSAFSAVASIMSIQLFPGLTLGLLFFLPLIAGIIIAIIWIVKR